MEVATGRTFRHSALLYTSLDDAAERVVPGINDALDIDAAVLVCLDERKREAISTRLGSRARRVSFVPAEFRYSRPILAVDSLTRFIEKSTSDGATAIHAVGEVAFDGSDRDADWLRYEAATNEIFADVPMHATCLYPRSLDERALDGVLRTHPYVDDHGISTSSYYRGPRAACAHLTAPRLAPDREPDVHTTTVTDPGQARSLVDEALASGGPAGLSEIATLVVSELVTNAILHGGGRASLSVWIEPLSLFVAVQDDGPGIDDPFAGLRPPALPHRGAGLWVANHLSERVSIERAPLGGATVTVQLSPTVS